MSKTVDQIFAINPTTAVADTDLYYLAQSPYTPGTDAAITGASLKAAFGGGGTINPGLIDQVAYYAASGSSLSGLATANNGVLITSAGGAPSISSTLPSAVQGNITAIGTISSIGSPLGATFGGTGVNNGANTATFAGNLNFAAGFITSGAFSVTQTYTGITNVTFPTSGTLATTSQLPTPSALTSVNDTNVTVVLGGTPATALLQATSLTLGWTGTLSGARGGTGVNNGASTITIGGNVSFSGAFTFAGTLANNTAVTFPTSGTLATTSQIPAGAALTESNDTNVTLTLGGSPSTALVNAASITAGWTGTLSGTRGGTGVNNGANTATFSGNLNFANSFTTSGNFSVTQTYTGATNVTFPTSGTLATTSQIPAGAALTSANDTNVTITLGGSPSTALVNAASITLGWTGTLSTARGGTGVSAFDPVVQRVSTETGTVATGTTTVPSNNSIPQNTAGDQYMSLSITPKASGNILRIDVTTFFANSASATNLVAALFQDATANALACGYMGSNSASQPVNISFTHTMTAGTTSSTTFKVRIGGSASGHHYI